MPRLWRAWSSSFTLSRAARSLAGGLSGWWRRRGSFAWRRRGRETPQYAAGYLFTDSTHILAAYQPAPKKRFLSGLGGKAEPRDVTVGDTAWRETMEELFHWRGDEVPPQPPSWTLLQHAAPVLQIGSYTEYVFNFEQLETLLRLLATNPQTPSSPCYPTFPLTLTALIHTRRAPAAAEVQHLAILPILDNLRIDPYFQQSISTFLLRRETPQQHQ